VIRVGLSDSIPHPRAPQKPPLKRNSYYGRVADRKARQLGLFDGGRVSRPSSWPSHEVVVTAGLGSLRDLCGRVSEERPPGCAFWRPGGCRPFHSFSTAMVLAPNSFGDGDDHPTLKPHDLSRCPRSPVVQQVQTREATSQEFPLAPSNKDTQTQHRLGVK